MYTPPLLHGVVYSLSLEERVGVRDLLIL